MDHNTTIEFIKTSCGDRNKGIRSDQGPLQTSASLSYNTISDSLPSICLLGVTGVIRKALK
jgi:hypothetical protein